ncbi:MAG: tRNA (adenosine(37)-N6)-dimethylallyltransferase MiaA [Candidatus Pacebacteria bacterium]|nr:tRNA (adenosine(37)-N6)-dimethylallyltransferase MiaA [Candidatus Paceibacterota bacterium]
MNKPTKILVVLGPTASGKSDLAVQLAKKFNGEIISADSRQVYRHLNIGTGKVTEREMRGIPHHLLDVIDPDERFTALEWRQLAEKVIVDIASRGKLPIVCGGTGFYISSLIDNLGFPEVPADTEEQKALEARTVEDLFDELKKLDPERAKTIDMKNKRRLARAIIIARALGSVPKLTTTKDTAESHYAALQIGITWPDTDLRARIKARLIRRMEAPNKDGINMIQEAEYLHAPAPSGLGLSYERMDELGLEYRYLAEYLQMKIDKIKLIEILVNKIWQYAKRQMTWWKKDTRIKWFSPENITSIEKEVEDFLK